MSCRLNCAGWVVPVSILVGVVLGVLYTLGFVATGVLLWAYLVLGAAALLLAPIYATGDSVDKCFGRYRVLFLVAAIGTVVAAAVGLIAVPLAVVAVAAILLGIVTAFATLLLATLVCLVNCQK